MKQPIEIPSLDNHHNDVFEMVHLLDTAIKKNSRDAFAPIVTFLSDHCLSHFQEEETIMRNANFNLLHEHQIEHRQFINQIKQIKKMYNENIHTTHIAYGIRQLIDRLIIHIQTIDIKMKGLPH
ncbi:MAG: bacteriohemerythrin [Candidatus Marinamargulisbacteria bacterium]